MAITLYGSKQNIIQIQQTVLTSAFTTTTQNSDITGLSVNITPSSASNKILVIAEIAWGSDVNAPYSGLILNCNGTQILGDALGSAQRFTVGIGNPNGPNPENATGCVNISYLHSPATTSSCTYKMQVGYIYSSRTVYINRNAVSTSTSPQSQVSISTITAIEVAYA